MIDPFSLQLELRNDFEPWPSIKTSQGGAIVNVIFKTLFESQNIAYIPFADPYQQHCILNTPQNGNLT